MMTGGRMKRRANVRAKIASLFFGDDGFNGADESNIIQFLHGHSA